MFKYLYLCVNVTKEVKKMSQRESGYRFFILKPGYSENKR